MTTTAVATVAALQMVSRGEDKEPIFEVVILAFNQRIDPINLRIVHDDGTSTCSVLF
jgi:hypothetical protein